MIKLPKHLEKTRHTFIWTQIKPFPKVEKKNSVLNQDNI